MKKVLSVNVGGICFSIDIDAYETLKSYLDNFESCLEKDEAKEVMEDIEARIAEIFQERIKSTERVVDEDLVEYAISILGKPENKNGKKENSAFDKFTKTIEEKIKKISNNRRRLYRDPDNKQIAGICSGIAEYFAIDVSIVRIMSVVLLIVSFGIAFIVYIIVWICLPEANTSAEKLELRGLPITPENIRKIKMQTSKEDDSK